MVIDESERPPVVAYGGRSPARSPMARQTINGDFQKALGPYIHTVVTAASPHGNGVITPRTRQQSIGEARWDLRHQVSPSAFNNTNHIFYKVSFS